MTAHRTMLIAAAGLAALTVAAAAARSGSTRSDVASTEKPTQALRSADVVGLLPEGTEKRWFLLDCTGCHQMDLERAFPEGRTRSRAEWHEIVERMLSYAGWQSAFPVISAGRDPAATADWLARHWTRPPTSGRRIDAEIIDADVREYAYPHPADLPHDLAVDADGRVVITGMFTHKMLVLDPSDGGYTDVPIPVPEANPRALDLDAAGDWWVLLGGPMRVARYRPGTDEWASWSVGVYGHSIRPDAQGRTWFNGHFTKAPVRLGYVDARTGDVRFFEVPGRAPEADGAGPIPYGLRVAPDGSVWMTELHGNRLVRLDPRTGEFGIWTLPTPHSGPRRLDVGPDGTVWIPEYAAGKLARFDPATERFTEYELPIADALPYVVQLDPERGRVWIGTGAADAVLLFDPASEQFGVIPLPTRGALVRHIDVDPATGDLWAAYGASPGIPPKIARVRLTRE